MQLLPSAARALCAVHSGSLKPMPDGQGGASLSTSLRPVWPLVRPRRPWQLSRPKTRSDVGDDPLSVHLRLNDHDCPPTPYAPLIAR